MMSYSYTVFAFVNVISTSGRWTSNDDVIRHKVGRDGLINRSPVRTRAHALVPLLTVVDYTRFGLQKRPIRDISKPVVLVRPFVCRWYKHRPRERDTVFDIFLLLIPRSVGRLTLTEFSLQKQNISLHWKRCNVKHSTYFFIKYICWVNASGTNISIHYFEITFF